MYRVRSTLNEHRLFASELKSLDRETQTGYVLERKAFLAKRVPEVGAEMTQLRKELRKMLDNGGDQLNLSSKYYRLAEKLLK